MTLDHTDEEVLRAHGQRLAGLDPWLPSWHPLPPPAPGDELVRAPEGVGLIRRERPDPASFLATWGAAEQYRLLPRLGGPDPVGSMRELLRQWCDRLSRRTGDTDTDTEATITWPSRDPVMTRLFLAHGLRPGAVVAAQPAGRATPTHTSPVRIRPLREPDLAAAAELWLAEVRWDAQFGTAVERPSTAATIRAELRGALAGEQPWVWVAETDGQVSGLLAIDPPAQARWVAPLVASAPAAYLGCLVVAAPHRGTGIGAALVQHGHAALREAEVAVTLLHYAAMNPLSGPFWHRCGYRPLWTIWQAQPASQLRVTT